MTLLTVPVFIVLVSVGMLEPNVVLYYARAFVRYFAYCMPVFVSLMTASFFGAEAYAFVAVMYSLGLPPEVLGLSALSSSDVRAVRSVYAHFGVDLQDSLQYLNKDNLRYFPATVRKSVDRACEFVDYEVDSAHKKLTGIIMDGFRKEHADALSENIVKAAWIRRFLG